MSCADCHRRPLGVQSGHGNLDELREIKSLAVDWRKYEPCTNPQQASTEEQGLYSKEAEVILIETAERLRKLLIAQGKRSHQELDYFEQVEEEHEDKG